jgi:Lrp/AsnC family leucine-responsive transcriptional regulator
MSSTKLDSIDWKILEKLQENARIANVHLADEVNLSPSPCLVRMKALEQCGFIHGYVTLLDRHSIGLHVNVFVQVRLEKQIESSIACFETAVCRREEVMECYLMTGTSDYLVRVVVFDLDAYESFVSEFLAKIPGVENIQSSFALKEVKYKTALPVGASAPFQVGRVAMTSCTVRINAGVSSKHRRPTRLLDSSDRRILAALQMNARIANVELADNVGLSPSPCLARVKALERDGFISRYVTLLDPLKVGLGFTVFVQVRLERQTAATLKLFETAINERAEIMESYLMTGTFDYLLRVVVADLETCQRFLTEFVAKVPGVRNIQSSFALKQVKYKTALPIPDEYRYSAASQ